MSGPVIDSHLHLWQLGDGGYRWVTPDLGELFRSFRAEEVEPDLTACGVDGVVLVQADDTVADTAAMLEVADAHPWVRGVVGWVQLEEPGRAVEQLDRFLRHRRFVGVRHLVHTEARRDFLELPPVRRSLEALAARGLPLDVPDAWPDHLHQAIALAEAIPELTIVLDHLAKPPRGRDDFPAWRAEFGRAATHRNIVAKVSGLHLAGADYSVDALASTWRVAIDEFGPDRLMWGSDWPITIPDGGYRPTFTVIRGLIETLSRPEQELLLGGTASRVYSLPAPGAVSPAA